MRWDGEKIKQGKKDKAKTDLKIAITEALNAGLYYEDICEIVAKTINKVAEEKKS